MLGKNTSNSSPRLVINPIGGLANRMRALASGITLAKEIGCDYRIVWMCNSELNATMEDIFNLPDDVKTRIKYPSNITYSLKYSAPRKKNLYLSQFIAPLLFGKAFRDSSPKFLRMIQDNDYESIKDITASTLHSGKDVLIQSGLNYYPFSTHLYRSIFKATDEIEKKADSIMNILGEEAIGFHIRRTDNKESIKHSPDALFMSEMDAKISENPKVKFYLATDDERTKKEFSGKYGDRIVFSKKAANRHTMEGIKQAATEMLVLSKTRRIVGSYYSSFSEAAAILGDKEIIQLYETDNQ